MKTIRLNQRRTTWVPQGTRPAEPGASADERFHPRRCARTYGLSVWCGRKRIRKRNEEDGRWKRDAPSGARSELRRANYHCMGDSEAIERAVGPIPKSSPI